MKKIMILFILILSSTIVVPVKAEDISLAQKSKSAIIMEASTGQIIFEKNSHEKLPPASMTKMMSMLLIVESVEKGIISWDEMVTASENASSMGGSQILLEAGEEMSVDDLFKGIAVASGNDAVVAMAEKIGGTVDGFVDLMNKRASELGLQDTVFKNPHGLNADGHYSSAYDMALIARELVKHPKVLEYTSIYEDYLRKNTDKKLWLVNTNKLVKFYKGIDGLKTGYTDKAGYCLTATMNKNNMRLISVVMKSNSKDNRNSDTIGMMEYGYSMYGSETILNKKDYSGIINIKGSENRNYKYYLENDIKIIVDKDRKDIKYTTEVKLNDVKAPIEKGSKV